VIPQFANPSEEFKRRNPHIFGVAGGETVREVPVAPADLKSEKRLQIEILNLLRLKGIEVLWHRTDKKTTCNVGWPDLLFAVEHGLRSVPCAWEVKLPGEKLSEDQVKVMVHMMEPPNAWSYQVVTSVEEALSILRRYGIS
jgi:hypothetical protein